MQLSLNSDFSIGSDAFHVQTEDWGISSPYIVSRIYRNGAVVRSLKTPYSELIESPIWDKSAIEEAVKSQHDKILDLILSGQQN